MRRYIFGLAIIAVTNFGFGVAWGILEGWDNALNITNGAPSGEFHAPLHTHVHEIIFGK